MKLVPLLRSLALGFWDILLIDQARLLRFVRGSPECCGCCDFDAINTNRATTLYVFLSDSFLLQGCGNGS